MTTLLFILGLAGRILLWILLIVLVLILLILFVPIRYRLRFSVDDPKPHDEADPGALRDRLRCDFRFSWLVHLVSGGIAVPERPAFIVRILFLRLDIGEIIRRHPKKAKEKPDKEKEQAPSLHFPFTPEELAEFLRYHAHHIYDTMKSAAGKLRRALRLLQAEASRHTLEKLSGIVQRLLASVLPNRTRVFGTIGLSDPALEGDFMAVLGMLMPFVHGTFEILPVFTQYQTDVRGQISGRIFLVTILRAALAVVLDRQIMRTLRRVRALMKVR